MLEIKSRHLTWGGPKPTACVFFHVWKIEKETGLIDRVDTTICMLWTIVMM